mgnify:CR=1 FL=1
MDVFGIFVVVSFMCIIITLVVMAIVKRINYSKEYTPYSEYYNHTTQDPSILYVDGNTNIKVHNDLQEIATKYLETLPHHKTRVKNRNKRQRKK